MYFIFIYLFYFFFCSVFILTAYFINSSALFAFGFSRIQMFPVTEISLSVLIGVSRAFKTINLQSTN